MGSFLYAGRIIERSGFDALCPVLLPAISLLLPDQSNQFYPATGRRRVCSASF